ncbi:MAG: putative capsular polysaccharide synthesis family protein [Eubacterium sp.]|nr:putative capsular polysaccharide synthesis family protein [Eubacterium sp.]
MIRICDGELFRLDCKEATRSELFSAIVQNKFQNVCISVYDDDEHVGELVYKSLFGTNNSDLRDCVLKDQIYLDKDVFQRAREFFDKNREYEFIPVYDQNNQVVSMAINDVNAEEEFFREFQIKLELLMKSDHAVHFCDLYPQIQRVCLWGVSELTDLWYRYFEPRDIEIELIGEEWDYLEHRNNRYEMQECASYKKINLFSERIDKIPKEITSYDFFRSGSYDLEKSILKELIENNRQKADTSSANEVIVDSLFIEQIELLKQKKLICCGQYSEYGKAYQLHREIKEVTIACFCETSDISYQSEKEFGLMDYESIPIVSVNEINARYKEDDYLIVILDQEAERIRDEVLKKCPDITQMITWFGLYYGVMLNQNKLSMSETFSDKLQLIIKSCQQTMGVETQGERARNMLEDEVLLIYQPGKVGSTTVSTSLELFGVPSIHSHFIVDYQKKHWGYNLSTKEIYQYFREHIQEKKVRIITMIRDPLSVMISSTFDRFGDENAIKWNLNGDVLSHIHKQIKQEMKTLRYGNTAQWFKDELKALTGIDVLDEPFDRDAGYALWKNGNISVLMLTCEQLDNNAKCIGDFVNLPNFLLVRDNDGAKKNYRFYYNEIKNRIRFSKEELDYYYQNDFYRHFYTEEQLKKFRKKWEKE